MDAKREPWEEWHEAVITTVYPVGSTDEMLPAEARPTWSGPTLEVCVKVHPLGHPASWDRIVSLSSKDIAPLWSHAHNWRAFRVDDALEARVEGRWHGVRVAEVDGVACRIRVTPVEAFAMPATWLPIMR